MPVAAVLDAAWAMRAVAAAEEDRLATAFGGSREATAREQLEAWIAPAATVDLDDDDEMEGEATNVIELASFVGYANSVMR